MTTFEGKSASYVAGKMPSNREPLYTAVGKKLLETLYSVHRERVLKVEKTVDDRLEVFDFLTDQSWKMISRRHQELRLMKHNEEFYARLSKLENAESAFTKEQKRHQKHIKGLSEYSNKLKAHGRQLKLDKINRENEHLHHKIQKAEPFYSRKRFKEEYQRNQDQINSGTRTDYTAGHLLKIPKSLAPRPLKKINAESSIDATISEMKSKLNSKKSMKSMNMNSLSMITSSMQNSLTVDASNIFSTTPSQNIQAQSSEFQSQSRSRTQSQSESNLLYLPRNEDSVTDTSDANIVNSLERDTSTENYEDDYEDDNEDSDRTLENEEALDKFGDEGGGEDELDENMSLGSILSEGYTEERIFLVSRPFALPYDTRNCLVEVFMSKKYDEQIYIKVLSGADHTNVISERSLAIDDVHDILEACKSIRKIGVNEDLQALRIILTNMFKEADKNNHGYLSYDEFQQLMENTHLGISPEELRFVISEADEDENGLIDYQEFVPLAVDMIQAFVARARAKNDSQLRNSEVEDQVLQMIATEELHLIVHIFEEKFEQYDQKKTGWIRTLDLRTILKENMQLGISTAEVNLICQTLPRDNLGRSDIREFRKAIFEVRFLTMKNTIIESQANDLEKYLYEICREEEHRLKEQRSDESYMQTSTMLPLRNIINMMIASPRLSLNRLQVVVIASEAEVVDGLVDYSKFIPVAAKTIEIMYEPQALKQRAELIEKTDLTPETLLEGVSPEVFKRRLLTLFKSCDTDKSGYLDMKEFKLCLESLDLKLTPSEIQALMASADADGNGTVDFEEFAEFCAHNLMHLEREKHIRAIQAAMKHSSESDKNVNMDHEEFQNHLRKVFRMADTNGSGFLSHNEINNLFHSLNIHLNPFELSVIISEADLNQDGLINYEEFVPVCADLIRIMRVDGEEKTKRKEKESYAIKKANQLEFSIAEDVQRSLKYIKQYTQIALDTIEDPAGRAYAIKHVLIDPLSGLSRQEANSVFIRLITNDMEFRDRRITISSAINSAMNTGSINKINLSNLEFILYDVRKESIIRNFMDDHNRGFVRDQILAILEKNAKTLTTEHDLRDLSNYHEFISVRCAHESLESLHSLRLNRSQIITIISFADCYDESGLYLDIKKFASYAAGCIENLMSISHLETRALAMKKGEINEIKAMNGMREEEIMEHLEEAVKHKEMKKQNTYEISTKELTDILIEIPGLYLNKKEAIAAIASIKHTSPETIDVRDFFKGIYHSLFSVCKERYISRRAKLLSHRTGKGDVLSVTSLAERLLDVLKLKLRHDKIEIMFTAEEKLDPNRKSSFVWNTPPPSAPTKEIFTEDEQQFRTATMAGEAILLTRIGFALPVQSILPEKPRKLSSRTSFSDSRTSQEVIEPRMMYGFASIYENDTFSFPDKSPLEFRFTSADSSFDSALDLPIKLPSIGLVDNSFAQEFAQNLILHVYVEFKVQFNTYELKFNHETFNSCN